jgi:hypothetical protein
MIKTAACSLTIAILLVALSFSKDSMWIDTVLLGALCTTFIYLLLIEKSNK